MAKVMDAHFCNLTVANASNRACTCNKKNSSYREIYRAKGTFLNVTRGLHKTRISGRITVPFIETCGETGGIQTRLNTENFKHVT
jgi:hypothetical protein